MTPPSSPPDPQGADLGAIRSWLDAIGWPGCRVEALAGDVGARHYLRATRPDGTTAVIAVYPPELRPACRRFATASRLLAGAGVRVPEILAEDFGQGRMLVEDLGERTLEAWARERPWGEVAARFRAAAATGRRVAGLDAARVGELSPPLDQALLLRELRLTRESFLEPEGLVAGERGRRLDTALAGLVAAIAAVPVVPCHRDFMVRNLMPWEEGVAVLDHQDLRLGPPLYDLASLLNDTLFAPAELEAELLAEAGAVSGRRRLEYHRVAAQRTLKAVGSYATAARRGQRQHVERIGPTFERALAHLAAVPETAPVAAELADRWRHRDPAADDSRKRQPGGDGATSGRGRPARKVE